MWNYGKFSAIYTKFDDKMKKILTFLFLIMVLMSLSGCSDIKEVFIDSIGGYDDVVPCSVEIINWENLWDAGYNAILTVQIWRWPWWVGVILVVLSVIAFVLFAQIGEDEDNPVFSFECLLSLGGPAIASILVGLNQGLLHWHFIYYVVDILFIVSVIAIIAAPFTEKKIGLIFFPIICFILSFMGFSIVSVYIAMVSKLLLLIILSPIVLFIAWKIYIHMG